MNYHMFDKMIFKLFIIYPNVKIGFNIIFSNNLK